MHTPIRSSSPLTCLPSVLYERLSAVPPSPDVHNHHALPPMHPGPGIPPQQSQPVATPMYHPDHSRGIDVNDHNAPDYIHSPANIRVVPGHDGRQVPVSDGGPIGPGVPPSHSMSAVRMSRRSSSGQDPRQLPPLSQLTPVQHLEHQGHPVHSQAHSPHLLPHGVGPDSRSRSHSSTRLRGTLSSQGPPHGYHPGGVSHPQQYSPESMSPAQQGPHSPPLSHERHRRHESHERGNHDHGRQQMSRPSSMLSPTSARGSSSSRIHPHQRMGPGANISHFEYENEREIDRERERAWSRHDYDREGPMREYPLRASSPLQSHLRSRPEYQEPLPPSSSYRQLREEQHYAASREPVGPGMYARTSRSGTPGSGSGSVTGNGNGGEGQSRVDLRDHPQYHERERPRPYALRAINHHQTPNEDEEGRSVLSGRDHDRIGYLPSEQHQLHPQQAYRPGMDTSRKRSRNDMELDGDDDVPSGNNSSGGGEGPSSRYNSAPLDRGSKRLHQDAVQAYSGRDEQEEQSD